MSEVNAAVVSKRVLKILSRIPALVKKLEFAKSKRVFLMSVSFEDLISYEIDGEDYTFCSEDLAAIIDFCLSHGLKVDVETLSKQFGYITNGYNIILSL